MKEIQGKLNRFGFELARGFELSGVNNVVLFSFSINQKVRLRNFN